VSSTDGPIASALDQLRAVIGAALSDELPKLLGVIEEIRAELWQRVHHDAQPVELLDVREAAALLRLPRRRVFDLARGASWARRVGRRLLIDRRALLYDVQHGRLSKHVLASTLRNATQSLEQTHGPVSTAGRGPRRADSWAPVAGGQVERG